MSWLLCQLEVVGNGAHRAIGELRVGKALPCQPAEGWSSGAVPWHKHLLARFGVPADRHSSLVVNLPPIAISSGLNETVGTVVLERLVVFRNWWSGRSSPPCCRSRLNRTGRGARRGGSGPSARPRGGSCFTVSGAGVPRTPACSTASPELLHTPFHELVHRKDNNQHAGHHAHSRTNLCLHHPPLQLDPPERPHKESAQSLGQLGTECLWLSRLVRLTAIRDILIRSASMLKRSAGNAFVPMSAVIVAPSTWYEAQSAWSSSSRTMLPRIRRCLVRHEPAAHLQTANADWLSEYKTLVTLVNSEAFSSMISAVSCSTDLRQVASSQMATNSLSAVDIVTKGCPRRRPRDEATQGKDQNALLAALRTRSKAGVAVPFKKRPFTRKTSLLVLH